MHPSVSDVSLILRIDALHCSGQRAMSHSMASGARWADLEDFALLSRASDGAAHGPARDAFARGFRPDDGLPDRVGAR